MEEVNRLAERILNRFEQHKHDLADKQKQLDSTMKELLDQRERLASVAKHKIETVIFPRMVELTQNFDNSKIDVLHTATDFSCICNLPIHRDFLHPSGLLSLCCQAMMRTSLHTMA